VVSDRDEAPLVPDGLASLNDASGDGPAVELLVVIDDRRDAIRDAAVFHGVHNHSTLPPRSVNEDAFHEMLDPFVVKEVPFEAPLPRPNFCRTPIPGADRELLLNQVRQDAGLILLQPLAIGVRLSLQLDQNLALAVADERPAPGGVHHLVVQTSAPDFP